MKTVVRFLIILLILGGAEICFATQSSIQKQEIKTKAPYKVGDIIGYSEPGLPERYVGKVVIFTERKRAKGQIKTPLAIDVDNMNNIYILDCGIIGDEKLIHKYTDKGEWLFSIPYEVNATNLHVSPEGYIYIYSSVGKPEPEYNLIVEYSPSGQFIATYQAPKDMKLGRGIYEENGALYSNWDGRKICEIKRTRRAEPLEKKETILPSLESMMEVIDNNRISIDLSSLRKSENRKIKEMVSKEGKISLKIPLERLVDKKRLIEVYYLDDVGLTEGGISRRIFKRIDKDRNMYILISSLSPEDRYRDDFAVCKYDLTGKLLAVVKMRKQKKLGCIPSLGYAIDYKGCIYEIDRTIENKIYIIKWEKQQ